MVSMSETKDQSRTYYFIDVDLNTRELIGWGTETRDKVEVNLTAGYHRVFLSKGQYNKLQRALTDSKRGLGDQRVEADDKALEFLAAACDGDARQALTPKTNDFRIGSRTAVGTYVDGGPLLRD